ncbi:MAG: hypothetical protein ACQES2_03115 [Pseudomonadota bacterium]
MEIRHRIGLCLLLLTLGLPALAGPILYYPQVLHQDARNEYYLEVLQLAIDKTAEEGALALEPYPETLSQNRAVRMLSGNAPELSVMWSMTTPQREAQMRPVRIPLLKGLMGFRLLIIREQDQERFQQIRNKKELAELTAGQGEGWPDADILKANGLEVATPTNYRALFDMLALERIDYIPRGVNEPWRELEDYPDQGFAVDSSLLLYYPSAHYFFVHRENRALAERIERGLERAVADGSFDKLFHNHPINARAFDRAGLVKRRMLRFDNPLLPEATPKEREELWWLPPQMKGSGTTVASP